MQKFAVMAALIAVNVLATAIGQAQEDASQGNVKAFMRAKLEHSQKVLEGLTIEDFDMIAKGAAKMEVLSQETAWQVLQTPEYRQQSVEFRRATQVLKEAANKKNVDAAALAFVDVTMKCVKCHQYVRNVRNANLDESFDFISTQIVLPTQRAGTE